MGGVGFEEVTVLFCGVGFPGRGLGLVVCEDAGEEFVGEARDW